ncbi:hypothetical protein JC606_03035 [Vibrio sp. IB15]|uniref:hypothetical protein n=1 Tax=Vibrio sp. IB15 TaxID=2779368 RepID=UPI0018E88E27|nr:hypothetical protein [Vibrio sp. IB15]MBJ2145354.1 hypothetical protein [Vibrio sp. IB15]
MKFDSATFTIAGKDYDTFFNDVESTLTPANALENPKVLVQAVLIFSMKNLNH